ncbi:hypothetical protein AB205_0190430 [Aquarana catesbeiana]|uniref:Uncharacterized protein n=1 Tax=Aquarana catesbeiana TaxID=8400 RepID=A0A2G9QIV9_AQUCT|nr:hypothetical protein AB205_0190430 [Aquarana catesbeiana]
MITLTQVKKPIQRQFHPKIINQSLKILRQILIGESGLLPPHVEHPVLSKSHLLRNISIV